MTDDKTGRIVSYDEGGALIRQMVPEIACTCKCSPEEHGPHGCKTWYGDRNSGFKCNCDWRLWKAPYAYNPMPSLRSTHQDRLALDCGRQIMEMLKARFDAPFATRLGEDVSSEELRQEIAQIILKNGFEKL